VQIVEQRDEQGVDEGDFEEPVNDRGCEIRAATSGVLRL
jgi:hypothetical protein